MQSPTIAAQLLRHQSVPYDAIRPQQNHWRMFLDCSENFSLILRTFSRLGLVQRLELPQGKFDGSISRIGGSWESAVSARVDQRGLFLELGLKGCKSGFLNRFNQTVDCGRPGVRLEYEGQFGKEHRGTIHDTLEKVTYSFTILEE